MKRGIWGLFIDFKQQMQQCEVSESSSVTHAEHKSRVSKQSSVYHDYRSTLVPV